MEFEKGLKLQITTSKVNGIVSNPGQEYVATCHSTIFLPNGFASAFGPTREAAIQTLTAKIKHAVSSWANSETETTDVFIER